MEDGRQAKREKPKMEDAKASKASNRKLERESGGNT